MQNLTYAFDNGGNVTSITDAVTAGRSQSFLYDSLDRLTRAQGAYGTENYSFDELGNFLVKGRSQYLYADASRPYAVTTVQPDAAPGVDGQTRVALDLDPSENLPIPAGGPTFTEGQRNGALQFNATSHMLTVPNSTNISVSTFALVAWVRPTAYPASGYSTVIAKSTGSTLGGLTNGYRLSIAPNGKAVFEMGAGTSKVTLYSVGAIPKNSWTYLGASYDGSRARMFVNGYQQSSTNVSWSPAPNTTPVTVGASPTDIGAVASNTQFLGIIDDPRLHGRAWYSSELTAVYNDYRSIQSFTYDSAGNTLEKRSSLVRWNYAYDSDGALRSVKKNNVTQATFIYDGDGGRVKKITPAGTNLYIGKLFEVRPDGTRVDHVFAGSRHLCDVVRSTTGAVRTFYYHPDHLGSVTLVTSSAGVVIQDLAYSPFGENYETSGTSPLRHKYTGQEEDPETDLLFYNARYYDPQLGRFITADSIVPSAMDPQSLNRYAYVKNNPIIYSDPTGHSFWKTVGTVAMIFQNPATGIYVGARAAGGDVRNINDAFRYAYQGIAIQAGVGAVVGSLIYDPTGTAAAALTDLALNTGEGKQIQGRVAHEVFQDVLGMSAKDAYFWSGVALRVLGTAAIKASFDQLLTNWKSAPNLTSVGTESSLQADSAWAGVGDYDHLRLNYSQTSGRMRIIDEYGRVLHQETGYSGFGIGKNNATMQFSKGVGPIPRGTWLPKQFGTFNGPNAFRLDPSPGLATGGRSGFFIHGGNAAGTASKGCMIMSSQGRKMLWNRGFYGVYVH